MIILGVDPGLRVTGYGVIECAEGKSGGIRLLEAGVVEPKPTDALPSRIDRIYQNLDNVISEYRPQVMVLEKLYAHYRHPTTACILGHARGVICLLCARRQLRFVEHSVKRIRQSLVGYGNATKQQTQGVVAQLLRVPADQLTLDASDALALALGFARMQRLE